MALRLRRPVLSASMDTDPKGGTTGTVAVLGATGSVGRAVCAALLPAGRRVLAVARHPASHTRAHAFVPLDVAAVAPGRLAALLDAHGVTEVVNATGGWGTTAEKMRSAHVDLPERLAAGCAATGRRLRVVQLGSIHEYGPVEDGVLINEHRAPGSLTPYGATKRAGSEHLLAESRAGRIDALVLRAVNVCGPHTTTASFLGLVVQRLRALAPGAALTLDVAAARRDFLDVRDLARAAVAALTAPGPSWVVNIGRGEAVPVADLVDVLVKVSGVDPATVRLRPAAVASKGGSWTCADIGLAADLLGWRPMIPLDASLRAMWEAAGDVKPPGGTG
ncbi:nad-dependent epimerase/dehydratase [Streptomyces zinciresistens K42]|uniref:Nad-dependent epimerase/dehydratase n=1 Tax=Streptomyces zinciresistens K42 TaxID=700597 RepID=G2G7J1_9ACTN|nr:NAD(P)-dependent oxidoreductase [Streptomyces zinciresistens]EGX60561.1 nad-dependent epimerase/dehydratase [Streptomyces zinciresistens K42]